MFKFVFLMILVCMSAINAADVSVGQQCALDLDCSTDARQFYCVTVPGNPAISDVPLTRQCQYRKMIGSSCTPANLTIVASPFECAQTLSCKIDTAKNTWTCQDKQDTISSGLATWIVVCIIAAVVVPFFVFCFVCFGCKATACACALCCC